MTIFHGKYIENFNNYLQNFPENAVEKAINTIKLLLDPHAEISVNKKLVFKVEEIRSLIHDSFIPHIRFVFCNNGLFWNDLAQKRIDSFLSKFPDRAEFIHFNHESIIKILHRSKKVDTYLKLSSQILDEDMNFIRVLIGRISVQEIVELFWEYGDCLLQRNIRNYLRIHKNKVNTAISKTLLSNKSDNFYFYSNGITVRHEGYTSCGWNSHLIG